MMTMDFNTMKNSTVVKKAAREMIAEKLITFFKNEFGEEMVSVIGNNEIAVCVGTRNDSLGNAKEICVTVKPTAKDYEKRTTTKKTFEAFDRTAAVKDYEASCEDKIQKKAEKKANK